MRGFRLSLVFLLLLLACPHLLAQWSGGVDAAGGLGAMPGVRTLSESKEWLHHYLGTGAVSLSYTAPRLKWNNTLSAGWESANKDFVNGDSYRQGQDTTINAVISMALDDAFNIKYRSEVAYKGQKGQMLSAWAQYAYGYKDVYAINVRFNELMDMYGYGDDNRNWDHNFGTGLSFSSEQRFLSLRGCGRVRNSISSRWSSSPIWRLTSPARR